jgi:hypothetical protein
MLAEQSGAGGAFPPIVTVPTAAKRGSAVPPAHVYPLLHDVPFATPAPAPHHAPGSAAHGNGDAAPMPQKDPGPHCSAGADPPAHQYPNGHGRPFRAHPSGQLVPAGPVHTCGTELAGGQ